MHVDRGEFMALQLFRSPVVAFFREVFATEAKKTVYKQKVLRYR